MLFSCGLVLLLAIYYFTVMGMSPSRAWVNSSDLGIYIPPEWPEEHHDKDGYVQPFQVSGRYQNPWMVERPSPLSFFWDLLTGRDESKIPAATELDTTLPVKAPWWLSGREKAGAGPQLSPARMTWLGHACVLAEVDGVAVLTDPIFSERASAVQFAGPARYRPAPCTVAQLPELSAVVISHSHYDHLDLNSVREIVKLQPNCQFFVPKGLRSWMVSNTGVAGDKVEELSWWEERPLGNDSQIKVALTPANHWCKRTATDDNNSLWGSWAVIGPNTSFWFGGDTGYSEAFKQIGRKYGPFTMAAIPIGAYQPNWFMKPQHVHPGEAVEIHKDINSKKSLGIHWGTFKLTTELYLEPKLLLPTWLDRNNLSHTTFVTTDIGGSVEP